MRMGGCAGAMLGLVVTVAAVAGLDGPDRIVLRRAAATELAGIENRVVNPGFEDGAGSWSAYGQGFVIDPDEAHSGAQSLRAMAGAFQQIEMGQTEPRAIVFAASSKAASVTGSADSDYALWLDVQYSDGSWRFGVTRPFHTGTHDWQTVDGSFTPEKPIERLTVYVLFRGAHQGQAWFDDVMVAELADASALFDGAIVQAAAGAASSGCGSGGLEVASGDGLRLGFDEQSGSVTQIAVAGKSLASCQAAAAGFFVRDVAAGSDFVSLDSPAAFSGSDLVLSRPSGPLGLAFHAAISPQADRVEIEATLENLAPQQDRAVTLYFALPLDASQWTWWDDLRNGRTVDGPQEFRNTIAVEWGATGAYSPHMLASLSGPAGLALAYPMDSPVPLRFAYNNALKIFYVAFDLALTADTAKSPNRATVRFTLYQHAPPWGMRAAFDKYIKMYPQFFEKRAAAEGIWVAFDSLASIPHPEDFGIQFHEVSGSDSLPFDQQAGVSAFRYLSEPWSYWMTMPPGTDSSSYQAVTDFLARQAQQGESPDAARAQAALESGVFYRGDRLLFWPQSLPWMNYGAVIVNNPNPDIGGGSEANKAHLDWSDAAQQVYRHPAPGQTPAGEYIDSFEATGTLLDYRRSHFAASSFPLSFSKDEPRLAGVPQMFSAYEFARWVAGDLHSRFGRLLMANQALNQMAFYAHAFDVLGTEINWAPDDRWAPDSDPQLLFRRMYAGGKPYLLLMNTDFSRFSQALVERYFQTALFYAMYPSLFSADASSNTYWSNPALYERDRPLFRRYIPWIRALSKAGWQPVTGARASDPRILVERYGEGDGTIWAVRNAGEESVWFRLAMDPSVAGLATGANYAAVEWIGGTQKQLESDGPQFFLTASLAPGQTQCWQLRRR